jgi:hypothetical protein
MSVYMSDFICIYLKKPGTHNDIQNACGTPHHFSQLWPYCCQFTTYSTK